MHFLILAKFEDPWKYVFIPKEKALPPEIDV